MECRVCGHELRSKQSFCVNCGELTPRGLPLTSKIGAMMSEGAEKASDGFDKLEQFALAKENRKTVIIDTVVLALFLTAFTSNPISSGFVSLVQGEPPAPRLTGRGAA